jgi:glutamate formiminotransferase/formiminotetrahydrofolate cyclodeaminase
MYRQGKLQTYLDDAAAKKPAPGGGSVAALAGALAVAMSEMAANFTAGNRKFASVEETIRKMLDDLSRCRDNLLDLMDEDVEAYSAVNRAYSMPKETTEQKAARQEAIRGALRDAMRTPLEVMRQCARLSAIADGLADIGNPNLVTDVGVSAILAEGACEAARLNVEVNLKFLDDAQLRDNTRTEMDRLSRQVKQSRESVSRKVATRLAG